MVVELTVLRPAAGDLQGSSRPVGRAIREREALASVNPEIAQIDAWERAGIHDEDELRQKAKAAKKAYEDALGEKFFHF